jgi:hypothetical protein
MPEAAETAGFAVSKGLAHRGTLFDTEAGRLTSVFCSIADTVGEFPQAANQPESDQDGDSGERESRFLDGPAAFANSHSNGTENWNKLMAKPSRRVGSTAAQG